jgi:hypothetical protein
LDQFRRESRIIPRKTAIPGEISAEKFLMPVFCSAPPHRPNTNIFYPKCSRYVAKLVIWSQIVSSPFSYFWP